MLTVKEINDVSFGKAGFSGYKPEDVDNFIDEVVASFQQLEAERDEALKNAQTLSTQNASLTSQNAEIQEKLAILAQRIETYREDEDGIKDVLLSAQKMAKDIVREAKDKAAIILQDAKDTAKHTLDDARDEAARNAREYVARTEEKKEELEEIKRQVTAFRASLLEMYKKHLECINHIPSFRQKETAEEPVPTSEEAAEPVPDEPVPAPNEQVEPAEPTPSPEEQPVPQDPAQRSEPREKQPQPERQSTAPTLHDRVDYSREQTRLSDDPNDYRDDLSEVGIDLGAYNDIPESLKQEKDSHYSNLEFGDSVDLGRKKHRK